MKTKGKRIITTLLVIMTLIFNNLVFAATTLDANGVPTEVAKSEKYVEIPVMQNGKVIHSITQYMTKNGKSGNVVINVRGYAYKTGETIKTGLLINYLAADGTRPYEFFDLVQGVSQEVINWPSCEGFYLDIHKPLEWDGPNPNQKRIIVSVKASTGGEFYRHTEKDVDFEGGIDSITLTPLNGGKTAIDTFETDLLPGTTKHEKIFEKAVKMQKDSTVKVDLNLNVSSDSKVPSYQVIQTPTQPTLPITDGTWTNLFDDFDTSTSKYGYKDLVDIPNKLTAQHYLYAPGFDKTPAQYGNEARDRAEVFKYPVNGVIYQSAKLEGNTKYSTQAEDPAFFKTTRFGVTTLKANFVPQVTGEYKFCVYSSPGANGKITVNGKQQVFANDLNTFKYQKGKPYYHTNDATFYLEKGKSYAIELQTLQSTNGNTYPCYDLAPCFMYALKPSTGWPEFNKKHSHIIENNKHTSKCYYAPAEKLWQVVTPTLLVDQKPDSPANRAVKYWGFIVPDVSGTFNFGIQADDGAYGYIVVNNQKKVFVDSLTLSDTQDKSNGEEITVEKNKAYPFYIEWYEGCPNEASLAPRYKEANGEWKDIPSSWFRPSSDTTAAEIPEAMYESKTYSTEIPLKNTSGKQYVAVKITTSTGEEQQILYGPFYVAEAEKVVDIVPNVMGDNNHLVPEGISNLAVDTTYKVASKQIKYTIDLNSVVNLKAGSTKVFECATNGKLAVSDLSLKVTEEQKGTGTTQDITSQFSTSVVDNKLVIMLKDQNQVIPKDVIHHIKVYYKTPLDENLKVGPVTDAGSYEYLRVHQKTVPMTVTVSRCPKVLEQVVVDGEVMEEEQYATSPVQTSENIPLTIEALSKVN